MKIPCTSYSELWFSAGVRRATAASNTGRTCTVGRDGPLALLLAQAVCSVVCKSGT